MSTTKIANLNGRHINLHVRNLFLFLLLLSAGNVSAQCLVSSLDISTGRYNSVSYSPGASDPLWFCVNKTGNYAGTLLAVGSNAVVVTNGSWLGGGIWISDHSSHASPGIVTTQTSTLTFERRFTLCSDDVITFDLDMRADGFIADISVDGQTTNLAQTVGTANWGSGSIWAPTPFSRSLAAGPHTLRIVLNQPPTNMSDPTGFFLTGTITAVNLSIINDQDPNCASYVCRNTSGPCDDLCYWSVTGNSINPNRNIFGTITDDNIRIVTNGSSTPDRGIITGGDHITGGYLGWNTTVPTARMHVNCFNGNNPGSVMGMPSDIRFENLEPGRGNILVIDEQGFVYDSGIPPTDDGSRRDNPGGMAAMQQEIRDLKMQLAELRSAVATGTRSKTFVNGNTLYQNTPNPFSRETSIKYNITNMQKTAFIVIYDLNGRELKKYPVNAVGEGNIAISAEALQPGIYLYSLVIDGQETDTKRMILSK